MLSVSGMNFGHFGQMTINIFVSLKDSVVDLVSGLGAPLSKLVIAAPVQAFKFLLQDKKHTAPGSPAVEVRSITRDELCDSMRNTTNWTLERDQDQAGPYIFRYVVRKPETRTTF